MAMRQTRGRTLFPKTLKRWNTLLVRDGDNFRWKLQRKSRWQQEWGWWKFDDSKFDCGKRKLEPGWVPPSKRSPFLGWSYGKLVSLSSSCFQTSSHQQRLCSMLINWWYQYFYYRASTINLNSNISCMSPICHLCQCLSSFTFLPGHSLSFLLYLGKVANSKENNLSAINLFIIKCNKRFSKVTSKIGISLQ